MGSVVEGVTSLALSPYEATMDSLGITRHGRDMVHQEQMAREQMNWQSGENQKNRDFSQQMYEQQVSDYMKNYPELMKKQSDIQFNQWKNQFGIESAYNSQGSQVARNLVAGVNPASQGSALTQGVSVSQPSVSPPPQIHGSPLGGSASPVGIPQGMNSELMSQFGQFMRDVSQAGVSRKTIEKLDADIQKELSEKDLIDSQRSYQEMKNGLYQVFGFRKETYDLLKLWQEAYRLKAAGDLDAATEKFQKANERLVNSEAKKNEDLLPILIEQNKQQIEVLKSEKKKNLAQAFEASQAGKTQITVQEYNKALTKTENALRDGKVTALELSNDIQTVEKYIRGNELKFSDATLENRIMSIAEGLKQQQLISQQQYEKLQQDIVATKWADRMQFMQYCTGFLGAAAQILGSSSGYYSGSLNRMSAKERNEIQSQFNDILDRHYTPVRPSEVRGFGYTPAWQE